MSIGSEGHLSSDTSKKAVSAFRLVNAAFVLSHPPGPDIDADVMLITKAKDIPRIAYGVIQILQAEKQAVLAQRAIKNLLKLGWQLKESVPGIMGFVTVDCISHPGRILRGFLLKYFPLGDTSQHFDAPIDTKMRWIHQMVDLAARMERICFKHQNLKCENIVLDAIKTSKS
ncbi:hypothetical protein BDD12DRAFT_882186 [Trichophaea hybrida]|nr:hypothetical protein BDD12DRAFT_882186 [Trichophaea hybrida]